MCETAQAKQRMGTRLTELNFKFHFYPWWREPSYELDPEGVVIGEDLRKYFDKIESCGCEVTGHGRQGVGDEGVAAHLLAREGLPVEQLRAVAPGGEPGAFSVGTRAR